ncbi:sulfotransferase family protein [Mesorhizobium sp. M0244]|uniref:sulfotransferase family protein n=1 Tax=Mesorhizobium sp. M0244 TaxID=2956926 RepID=UPI0033364FEC
MSDPNLDQICAAIKADDAKYLYSLPLAPEGRYQAVEARLTDLNQRIVDTLARAFEDRSADSFPALAVSCGKCRVGSTALTNLFGIAGLPSYYQPVKTVMRFEALGQPSAPWIVPDRATTPLVHCKEMTGPYLLAECLFDPIDLLVAAGYPAAKITMVALEREPVASLDSWLEKWSQHRAPATLVQHYLLSALNAARIERNARRHGIRVVNYVYEASKHPHAAVAALLDCFDLGDRFTPALVDDWGKRGSLESPESLVRFPVEPAPYVMVGLHASETRYRFKDRNVSYVTDEMRALLARKGITDIYARARNACFTQLKLEPEAI